MPSNLYLHLGHVSRSTASINEQPQILQTRRSLRGMPKTSDAHRLAMLCRSHLMGGLTEPHAGHLAFGAPIAYNVASNGLSSPAGRRDDDPLTPT